MAQSLVIVNPIAGQGTAASRVPEIERLLEGQGFDHRIELTERPWHAAEFSERAAREGAPAVVAAGGDGTANEVLNGLMRARGAVAALPAMGILCVGRGNDFAYGAGVPTDLEEGCRALADGYRRPMDVGLIEGGDYPQGRYFGNGIGVGFDTIVGLEAAKMKSVHGFAAYVLAAFRTLFLYYRAPLLRIERDGETSESRSIQISLMNGSRMGGTFFMAPAARNDDGFLDLCMADSPSRPAMVALLLKYMKGRQAESPHIATGLVREMSLTALDGELAIHADGETICTAGAAVKVRCLPAQLQMICRRPAP